MRGERVMQPNFGSNLHRLLFEPMVESDMSLAIEEEILNVTSV